MRKLIFFISSLLLLSGALLAAPAPQKKTVTTDLGADSLDTVELIMEFEKEFGITIPDDKAETISTVGDAIKYIEAAKQ